MLKKWFISAFPEIQKIFQNLGPKLGQKFKKWIFNERCIDPRNLKEPFSSVRPQRKPVSALLMHVLNNFVRTSSFRSRGRLRRRDRRVHFRADTLQSRRRVRPCDAESRTCAYRMRSGGSNSAYLVSCTYQLTPAFRHTPSGVLRESDSLDEASGFRDSRSSCRFLENLRSSTHMTPRDFTRRLLISPIPDSQRPRRSRFDSGALFGSDSASLSGRMVLAALRVAQVELE